MSEEKENVSLSANGASASDHDENQYINLVDKIIKTG